MRWFRTFALLLLVLFVLLIGVPGYRCFQTRKPFVPAGGPPSSELVYAVVPASDRQILPLGSPGGGFDISDPIGEYLRHKKMMADIEPIRIDGTSHYDLRPFLSKMGIAFPPEAVAMWDPSVQMALFRLPPDDLGTARLLLGLQFDEWEGLTIEIRTSLVAVDLEHAADFIRDPPDLDLAWLAGLPPETVRTIHTLVAISRSGQRVRTTSGDPDSEDRDFADLEADPVLGVDNITIDLNFAYNCRITSTTRPENPVSFRITTMPELATGHAMVFELGTERLPDSDDLAAYYLVLQVDRLSKLGKRRKNAMKGPSASAGE